MNKLDLTLPILLAASLCATPALAQDAAPADRNAVNTTARPAGMMADSPVTFPQQGALPAKYPPDFRDRAEPSEKDCYIFSTPCRSLAQIAAIQKDMPPGQFTKPPADWTHLRRTRRILTEGGDLRLLALGDSIVNDTMRSGWVAQLQEAYPKARIDARVFVRGGGGCHHYREEGRVEKYILPWKPDLVYIGGISQKDIASIGEVIRQLRAGLPEVEILLATGTFGSTDPRDPVALAKAPHSGTGAYGQALKELAAQQRGAYLDMTTPWVEYILSAKVHPHLFYRDVVHANEFGEQILAKIMMAFWTAPDHPESAWLPQRLEWFQDLKFGFMVHWVPYSLWGCIESWPLVPEDKFGRPDDLKAWTERNKDMARFTRDYWALPKAFNPIKFDPGKWAAAAKGAGMKYVVFTTKHHDGFSMFDTKLTDYRITSPDVPFHADPRADVVRGVFDSFRKEGMAIGAYFSKSAANDMAGLAILDITTPRRPTLITNLDSRIDCDAVAFWHDTAVLYGHHQGQIVLADVRDPVHPRQTGVCQLPKILNGGELEVADGFAYVTSVRGLFIVNVADSAQPTLVATVDMGGTAHDVVLDDGFAFVAVGTRGVCVLDVHDPQHPVEVGRYPGTPEFLPVALAVARSPGPVGNAYYLYVASKTGPAKVLRFHAPHHPQSGAGQTGQSPTARQ